MEPTPNFLRVLLSEEVVRAREMAPEDKLLEGARLFDRACQLMADGIRHRHPGVDSATVQELLAGQLAIARKLEQSE